MGIFGRRAIHELVKNVNGNTEEIDYDQQENNMNTPGMATANAQQNDNTDNQGDDNNGEDDGYDPNNDDANDYTTDPDEDGEPDTEPANDYTNDPDEQEPANDYSGNTDDDVDDTTNNPDDNTDTADDTGNDDPDYDPNSDDANDYTNDPDDDPNGDPANDYTNDGEGGDDTGDDDMGGEDNTVTDSPLKSIETDLFKDLTPEQLRIKNMELKQQYIEVYGTITASLARLEKVDRTQENVKPLKFIIDKLNELKELISFYLKETYDTKTYIENNVMYQKYLVVLNTMTEMLQKLKIKE